MEHEPRSFPEGEQPIEPEKAAIPGIEILVDAATGMTDQQRSEIDSALVTPEVHDIENPYSR
ncbi:hypothetical protein IH980_00130 [Patescibacteria group bacterium]|nr:hypothetical protein [Patescibacteria group bacterium]